MIKSLSQKLALYMINSNTITKEEKELYEYGFFLSLSQILYFIITLVIGSILNVFLESIVFYFAFQGIRKIAGGYHASTEFRCELLSTSAILGCLILIRNIDFFHIGIILMLSVLTALVIYVFAPLDTLEKPLSSEEYHIFKKKSRIVLLIILISILVSHMISMEIIFYPCCMSLFLESILLIAGKIKNSKRKIDIE